MVRFKKRYFVVQFDREKDIRKASRAHQDPRPLDIPDGVLASAIKDKVEQLHGDFGRASITTGLRTIYCNPQTHLALIQCRHGPHRLVASSLPFLTTIHNEKIVPKLVYTGATIKNCYKRMQLYQKKQLEAACKELKNVTEEEKQLLEEQMMAIRSMN